MLDLDFIRRNPEVVKRAVQTKGESRPMKVGNIDRILSLDKERRQLITQTDTLRQRRNQVSDEIAQMRQNGAKDT